MRILNTSTRPLENRRPTARTSAIPRPRLRLRKHSEAPHFTCTLGWCCLTLFAAICSYPGCTYPAVMYPKDHYWNYCSESHERYVLTVDLLDVSSFKGLSSLARKGCINCRQPAGNSKQLCKGCEETFKYHNPTIIPVPMDHDAFWNGEADSTPRRGPRLIQTMN